MAQLKLQQPPAWGMMPLQEVMMGQQGLRDTVPMAEHAM